MAFLPSTCCPKPAPSPFIMATRTSIEWALSNPVLNAGATAYESDTGKWKLGNGKDRYVDLQYQAESGGTGAQGPPGPAGANGVNGLPGLPVSLAIGTVTIGPAASASITGSPPNQFLNLVLPVAGSSGDGSSGGGGTTMRFVVQPEDESVIEGDAVVFSAEATQSAGTLVSYKWQFLPANTSDQTKWADVSAPPTSSLRITATASLNGQSYRCIATAGSLSVVSGSALLSVAPQGSDAVVFTAQPFDSSIAVGGTAIFRVVATINTGVKVAISRASWKWQGSAPVAGGGWDANSWVDLADSTGSLAGYTFAGLFSFTARTADNGRQFRCVVTAEKGSVVQSYPSIIYGNYQPVPNGTENSNPATLTVT